MGQARINRRAHSAVIDKMPFCIYCGGQEPASTVDHMPPAVCFRWRQRPKGLEFSACKICNEGASYADYVAGLVSRFFEPNNEGKYVEELISMFRSVSTNIPGLLEEMKKPRGSEKLALNRLPVGVNGGVVNVSGPILSRHIEVFALKLGLALHYEHTKEVLGPEGGIAVRWFSNYELFTGEFPDELKNIFPVPKTLTQGRVQVSDQFEYASIAAEDKTFGAYFASFRLSFSIVAFVAGNRELLHSDSNTIAVYSPSDLKTKILELNAFKTKKGWK